MTNEGASELPQAGPPLRVGQTVVFPSTELWPTSMRSRTDLAAIDDVNEAAATDARAMPNLPRVRPPDQLGVGSTDVPPSSVHPAPPSKGLGREP